MRILILGAGSIGISGMLLSALDRAGIEGVVYDEASTRDSRQSATTRPAREVIVVDGHRYGSLGDIEDFLLTRTVMIEPAETAYEPPDETLAGALSNSPQPNYTPKHSAAAHHRTVKDSVWDGGHCPTKAV